VLTPLAVDPAHPFPQVLSKSLNLIVELEINQTGRRIDGWPSEVPRFSRASKLPR
jgi:polyphosphate kinase